MQTSGLDDMPQGSLASLAWGDPLVQEWFAGRFGSPTEPQEQGWPPILAGKSTLICAPTGEIVTLSAADPLNLVGIIVPGERVPAISGKTITLRDGAMVVEQPCGAAAAVPGGTDVVSPQRHAEPTGKSLSDWAAFPKPR